VSPRRPAGEGAHLHPPACRQREKDSKSGSKRQATGNVYVGRGKAERWVAQTTSTTRRQWGFLADRLAKLGVETTCSSGCCARRERVDRGREFDWEPTLSSSAELITSPRGTDSRLDDNQRDTNRKRRQTYLERNGAKAEARPSSRQSGSPEFGTRRGLRGREN